MREHTPQGEPPPRGASPASYLLTVPLALLHGGSCLRDLPKKEAVVSVGQGAVGHTSVPIRPCAHLARHRIIPQVSSAALRLLPVGVLRMESSVTVCPLG